MDNMQKENYIKELLDVVMFDLDTLCDSLSEENNTYHQNDLRKENCIKTHMNYASTPAYDCNKSCFK